MVRYKPSTFPPSILLYIQISRTGYVLNYWDNNTVFHRRRITQHKRKMSNGCNGSWIQYTSRCKIHFFCLSRDHRFLIEAFRSLSATGNEACYLENKKGPEVGKRVREGV